MNTKNEIVTSVVKPMHPTIIENNIGVIVAQVQQEIAELHIETMEVSEENKQTLKNARASLNKKLSEFETERKKIKDFVLKPYNEFETVYNEELKTVINVAVKQLDDKVKSIETEQKKELENYAIEYFNRKLESDPIKIANKFENVTVSISLSTNKKRIREEIDFHFDKIKSATLLIENHQHPSRLRVLFENEARYDIGVALTMLTKQLLAEEQYKEKPETMDLSSMYPKVPSVTKVPVVEEKKSQKIIGEVYDFKLTITVSEEQLAALTAFMEKENITFEVYED